MSALPHRLARFCYEKSGHFSIKKNCVLLGAFMPPPELELSVFVIDGMDVGAVHQHGRRYALRKSEAPAAFGSIAAADIGKQQLTIDRNDDRCNNPPLHADVRGWPKEKSEQKLIAIQLAAAATLQIAHDRGGETAPAAIGQNGQ